MFDLGNVIDNRFVVVGKCSDHGGMGVVLLVNDALEATPEKYALKYCRPGTGPEETEVLQDRFRREVNYLYKFIGNDKVVQMHYDGLHHDPPFYVMPFYEAGDLTNVAIQIRGDLEYQELIFMQMIDAVGELHQAGITHRDLKPQNFLQKDGAVIVSDLGLSKAPGAGTTFTKTAHYAGTPGYLPPEYHNSDAFREADFNLDIYMLGKTFYALASGHDPLHMNAKWVHSNVYSVFERCCYQDPTHRIQNTEDLKKSLKTAFDIALNRIENTDKNVAEIADLEKMFLDDPMEAAVRLEIFLENLLLLRENDFCKVVDRIENPLFNQIGALQNQSVVLSFLVRYDEEFLKTALGPFEYAETVAFNMKSVFITAPDVMVKVKALDIACDVAESINRYRAMNTCTGMVQNVTDDATAQAVSAFIQKNKYKFLSEIEPDSCKSLLITRVLLALKAS